jgi:hypothetical protein
MAAAVQRRVWRARCRDGGDDIGGFGDGVGVVGFGDVGGGSGGDFPGDRNDRLEGSSAGVWIG